MLLFRCGVPRKILFVAGPARNPVCAQPKIIGMCRAAFDAWYFDSDSGQCEHFIYGGCGGNDNNFHTKEECQHACFAPAADSKLKRKSNLSTVEYVQQGPGL